MEPTSNVASLGDSTIAAMFATLLGALPVPAPAPADWSPRPPDASSVEAQVEVAVRAQEERGLEPLTDGRLRTPTLEDLALGLTGISRGEAGALVATAEPRWTSPLTVEAWRVTAALTDRAVKQALPGPYTLGRRIALHGLTNTLEARERLTLALAKALRREVDALAAVGCPLVEIEEAEAHRIGDDEAERRLFREAHRRLAEGVTGTHLSLSIVGGAADGAGPEAIFDAPYASYAFDLIAGPDNWRLVTHAPADRGVIVGVQSGREAQDEPKEVMLWAAHYAASTGGRGLVRVGLGSAAGYAGCSWAAALRKMAKLGETARLASMPPSEELARSLDPRAVSSRRAALGHDAPKPRRR
jgi:methionine synthase II (cobalamin-independent)